jgi:hypothetical protein
MLIDGRMNVDARKTMYKNELNVVTLIIIIIIIIVIWITQDALKKN